MLCFVAFEILLNMLFVSVCVCVCVEAPQARHKGSWKEQENKNTRKVNTCCEEDNGLVLQ